MKKTITLLFTFLSFIIQAQEFKTKVLLPPNATENSDLSFLKKETANTQVVLLGELTHMYGNIFSMKTRVAEYLHKELGFNTIAIESSMYDLWKMNKKGFDRDIFKQSIWNVWSGNTEFERLINYIEENNLKVIGFDSQVNNTSQFIDDFFDYCKDEGIKLQLEEDEFAIFIENAISDFTIDEEFISYKDYQKELSRIQKEIEKLDTSTDSFYWKQFVKNIIASSRDAFKNKEEILSTNLTNKNHNIRDQQMADNLLRYIQKNPTEKLIVWADNIHVMNDNSHITKPIAKEFISMGSYIKKELKNKAYSLATIHANDSIFDYGTKKWAKTPVKKNSFEDKLKNFKNPYLFLSSNQEAMRQVQETRLIDFVDFTPLRLDKMHDGYIFLNKATLPKKETEIAVKSKGKITQNKSISKILKKQSITLKGQVINKETNTLIPYANVILKNEAIYRIADENGFYELPVTKTMLKTTSVEISSIGFKSVKISLEKLQEKTYLTPNIEALDEVVITGYLSPKSVLKKAIKAIKSNHPTKPFNFYRYGNVHINKDDTILLDLELITKDCDYGYLSDYVISQRVEQIKWNEAQNPKKYKRSAEFFSYRQNAIRYANILHKRKYKRFDVAFVKSNKPEDEGLYVISFKTERSKWNYTNKGYPTQYSGFVYIDRESFAIVKVVENWATTLTNEEINEHFNPHKDKKFVHTDKKSIVIKEENTSIYANVLNDEKYYATNFFNRRIIEMTTKNNIKNRSVEERSSYLFDFETKNVEEIEYYEYNNKKENSLHRINYNKSFWDRFYTRKIK